MGRLAVSVALLYTDGQGTSAWVSDFAHKAGGHEPSAEDRLDISQLNRADRFFPEGGLVLKVNTRDLPRVPRRQGVWASAWNQDFAWFTKDEARQFLPGEIAPGRRCEVPRLLVERLARLHFLDNVRGQTWPFPTGAIEDATLTSEVAAVDGEVVSLRLKGRTRAVQKGTWSIDGHNARDVNRPSVQKRGVDLKLLGMARFDREQGRFVGFEVVAVGTRWGGTQHNFRSNDLAPAPFGAMLSLAGKSRVERVAPEHFQDYGWALVEWFPRGGAPVSRPRGPDRAKAGGAAESKPFAQLSGQPYSQPEEALKSFLVALAAHDEAALREIALPHPRLESLVQGPSATTDQLALLKARLQSMSIRRLKAGDSVEMPNGESRVIQPDDVRTGRVVLWADGEPMPTRLENVGGRWKVFAGTFMGARK